MTITLTGSDLTAEDLAKIVGGAPVSLAEEGLATMAAAREVIDEAVRTRTPVYGVTTGLGPRVVEALSEEETGIFALNAVRGRAHSAGDDLPEAACRAALAVRANTLLIGAAGAKPEMALQMASCLNAGLAPAIRGVGSIGAADLMWGGDFGLALIGEGRMWAGGRIIAASDALAENGVAPYAPGPREGLALVSHSSVTAGLSLLAVAEIKRLTTRVGQAAALSLEGFRGNLSPFDPALLALRPQPGQDAASAEIMDLLAGSPLLAPGAARRLQDPLSLRNIPQVHGALHAALDHARIAVEAEANGASDNPGVVIERGEVTSHGGYLSPHLSIALGGLCQSIALVAATQQARCAKLLSGRFSDLPNGLLATNATAAGMGPAMKTAEALFAEISHAATPAPIFPSASADGLEDVTSYGGIAAKTALRVADAWRRLIAFEMMVAAQAVDLREVEIAPALRPVHAMVREVAAPVDADRPLGGEIEALAALL